ncbi:hypothetical protein H5410_046425 [Solanum commersonii]|uniref:Uncharacterized protein n=1 Tax=Solanum commersonii TaxID=4109 RepID=A0A9J5XEE3_SOLCO|nr:hypothetical protein H5410_046425 [Solanum commersonii]
MVNYRSKVINVIYGLLDHDIEDFNANGYKLRNWQASKLCLGKNCHIAEVRILMYVVCNRISPSGNIRNIPMLRAKVVACLLYDVPLFKIHGNQSCIFPSLITELWTWVKVEELSGETWVKPKHQIIPLKMRGEGTILKSK